MAHRRGQPIYFPAVSAPYDSDDDNDFFIILMKTEAALVAAERVAKEVIVANPLGAVEAATSTAAMATTAGRSDVARVASLKVTTTQVNNHPFRVSSLNCRYLISEG